MNSKKQSSENITETPDSFNFDFSFEEFENNDAPQNKRQMVAMVKKLHLATVDVIKLINHYKKISLAGHVIPGEVITQLQGMAKQLISTSENLSAKADAMVSNLDEQIESTNKLIKQAEDILNANKI